MSARPSPAWNPVADVPLPGPPLAPPLPSRLRQAGVPRINLDALPMVALAAVIVPPGACRGGTEVRTSGLPPLPGPGGIVLTHRVGDRCVGLAADRLEPGAAVQAPGCAPVTWTRLDGSAGRTRADALNRALNDTACIGNRVLVLTGPARGQRGVVTGMHGACGHVSVDFPPKVLRRLRVGDRLQIYAQGQGLRMLDHPELRLRHCSPRLLRGWGLASKPPRLLVPVTHRLPGGLLEAAAGSRRPLHYRIRDAGSAQGRRLGLSRLRFGDLVAVRHPGASSPAGARGLTTIAVVVSGEAPFSGLGPGLLTLIWGSGGHLEPVQDPRANLAAVLRLRPLPKSSRRRPGKIYRARSSIGAPGSVRIGEIA